MSMSLAELDAQDVTLLPERATLHHGGITVTLVSIHQTSIANAQSFGGIALFGSGNNNTAIAGIVNL